MEVVVALLLEVEVVALMMVMLVVVDLRKRRLWRLQGNRICCR
jgi:hypothetical protein